VQRNEQPQWITSLVLLVLTLVACGRSPSAPVSTQEDTQFADLGEPTVGTTATDSYERFDISEDLYVRRVEQGVFVVTHSFPWAGNSMIVEMENSELVLVDTPYTPEATRDLLEWITTQLGERKVTAINTGFHYDNLGGNRTLAERGIPVYGSLQTARLLEERGEEMRAMTLDWLQAEQYQRYREAHRTLPYVAPTSLFDLNEGLELQFGDEIVQVHYPGPSHSPDNVVVYFPGRKLLFGGCMIIGMDQVGNTSDADLAEWPNSVRDLARFDFVMLIPGHGDRLDPGLVEHTLDLLADFQQ
jgi:metallo-beta-lactamase class B